MGATCIALPNHSPPPSSLDTPCHPNAQLEVVCILAYFLLLEALPLGVVLMYNRTAPLSTSRPPNGRGASGPSGRRRSVPEEEPLIGGSDRLLDDNTHPFNGQTEIPRAIVHR